MHQRSSPLHGALLCVFMLPCCTSLGRLADNVFMCCISPNPAGLSALQSHGSMRISHCSKNVPRMGVQYTTQRSQSGFMFVCWDGAGTRQVEAARPDSAFDCGSSTGQHWASRGMHPISVAITVVIALWWAVWLVAWTVAWYLWVRVSLRQSLQYLAMFMLLKL